VPHQINWQNDRTGHGEMEMRFDALVVRGGAVRLLTMMGSEFFQPLKIKL
jgi:hypothetical protein